MLHVTFTVSGLSWKMGAVFCLLQLTNVTCMTSWNKTHNYSWTLAAIAMWNRAPLLVSGNDTLKCIQLQPQNWLCLVVKWPCHVVGCTACSLCRNTELEPLRASCQIFTQTQWETQQQLDESTARLQDGNFDNRAEGEFKMQAPRWKDEDFVVDCGPQSH